MCPTIKLNLPIAQETRKTRTSQDKSIVQHRLLRQRKQESEYAADGVQTLQRIADPIRDTTDGRVCPTVVCHDVRVQVDVTYFNAINHATHLTTDALWLVCQRHN